MVFFFLCCLLGFLISFV
uniref:Uncharacterized protein n=1 Tax=Rhizophora mucronata TaxID=61149 RepID=A0A2P2N7E5_RHIMU